MNQLAWYGRGFHEAYPDLGSRLALDTTRRYLSSCITNMQDRRRTGGTVTPDIWLYQMEAVRGSRLPQAMIRISHSRHRCDT